MSKLQCPYPKNLCCTRCNSFYADSYCGYDLHWEKCNPTLPIQTIRGNGP